MRISKLDMDVVNMIFTTHQQIYGKHYISNFIIITYMLLPILRYLSVISYFNLHTYLKQPMPFKLDLKPTLRHLVTISFTKTPIESSE